MPTWTFVKRGGAPSGAISLTIGNDTFLIDDVSNTSIAVTSSDQAYELNGHPYLTLQGTSGTTPGASNQLVQQVFLVNGVLSMPAGNGSYSPVVGQTSPSVPNFVPMGNVSGNQSPAISAYMDNRIEATLTGDTNFILALPQNGQAFLMLTQDATGGHAVQVGPSSGQLISVPVPQTGAVPFMIYVYSDGTQLWIQGPTQAFYVVTATNAAFPIPPQANYMEIIAIGGGGGGEKSVVPTSNVAQIGASGGAPGIQSRWIGSVGANTSLNLAVGTAGTGGIVGGAAAGYGGDSTATGNSSGLLCRGYGGGHGVSPAVGATSGSQVQVWGAKATNGSTQVVGSMGTGGVAAGPGSPPFDYQPGGGGGGGNVNTTGPLGGTGGGAGTATGPGAAGSTGASGGLNGTAGANATALAAGGGGAGAAAFGGTAANGGNGAPGFFVVKFS